jgi:hypothetical protein
MIDEWRFTTFYFDLEREEVKFGIVATGLIDFDGIVEFEWKSCWDDILNFNWDWKIIGLNEKLRDEA